MSASNEVSNLESNAICIPDNDVAIQEILHNYAALREYTKEMQTDLKNTEKKSNREYLIESENIASLNTRLHSCDQRLERMEKMLVSFQNRMKSVSSEVTTLQDKSISLSKDLARRLALKEKVVQFIDDIKIPEQLIVGIITLQASDEEFLNNLQMLSHKISIVNERTLENTEFCQVVKDVLEKLKEKAVQTVRQYIFQKISNCRKTLDISESETIRFKLLKCKEHYHFLLSWDKEAAEEMVNEYVDTMQKVYYSHFKSYARRIMKLQAEDNLSEADLMGVEEIASGDASKSFKYETTIFSMGNRADILSQIEEPIIVPHAGRYEEYRFECLFRSLYYDLLDKSCGEYLFDTEYFIVRDQSALDFFSTIMDKTLILNQQRLKYHTSSSYDVISMFLCFHLVQKFKKICAMYSIPALDNHWQVVENIFLQRFEYLMQMHIKSIDDYDMKTFKNDMGPHYIARRYAEFTVSLDSIKEDIPNERIGEVLTDLHEKVESFIQRIAGSFKQRKHQLTTLINNYDIILTTLVEKSGEDAKQAEHFRSSIVTCVREYAEEVTFPYFKVLILYVKNAESYLQQAQIKELKELESNATEVAQHFNETWAKSLESLNREVLLAFPKLETGSRVLQMTFTQFVQYYHRFYSISKLHVRSLLVNITLVKAELEKYKIQTV